MTVRVAPASPSKIMGASSASASPTQVGADGSDLVYRARFEKGFARYRWVAAGAGEEGYWVADNPDGSRRYAGGSCALVARTRYQGVDFRGEVLVDLAP